MIKIQFLGATGTVTGSKYLLTVNQEKYLIDCGLFQGLKQLRLRNWEELTIPATKINAVFFTHAHIDHTGYFPLLVKNGFSGPAFCSEATQSLCKILLPDSAYLHEEEARFLQKHKASKHKKPLPLYTQSQAWHSLEQIEAKAFNSWHTYQSIRYQFIRNGHLFGSAYLQIEAEDKIITFSGDVGRPNDPLLKHRQAPQKTDYLILESTYGDRLHKKISVQDQLKEIITSTFKKNGIVLIPSFAIGRAQEIIYHINQLKKTKQIPDLPLYLNSPMAKQATHFFFQAPEEFKVSEEELRESFQKIHFVNSPEESRELNEKRDPCIIISSSGMLTGGRVLHHMKALAPDPKNSIVIAGFQAAGTRGEALLRGKNEIRIHGQYIPVKAQIFNLENISAHADYEELLEWTKNIQKAPFMTFITHGEPIAADEMRRKIEDAYQWNTCVPDYKEEFIL